MSACCVRPVAPAGEGPRAIARGGPASILRGMARRDLNLTKILDAAAEQVDATGRNDFSIGELAQALDVQPSALYNHVENLDGLRHALCVHATNAAADRLVDAAVAASGANAIRSIANAYRNFAQEHPGQYASHLLPAADADDDLVDAHRRIVEVFVRVVNSVGLEGDAAIHAARTLRSAIHGFLALEAIEGFTSNVDQSTSFSEMVDFLITGVAGTSH